MSHRARWEVCVITEMLLGSIAAVMTSLVKCKTNQDLGTDRAGVK